MFDSWTCHICGERRPDAIISVFKHDRSSEYNLPDGTFVENIRYCNDKVSCTEQAKIYSHLKKEPNQERVENKKQPMKYILRFIIYLIAFSIIIGFVDMAFGSTFMHGFIPLGGFDAGMRWLIRITFVSYFTFTKPLPFEKKK